MTDLARQAETFAQNIADAISAFVGQSVAFVATSSGSRFVVSDEDGAGVVLKLTDAAHLTLEVNYRCELDSTEAYLKVLSSRVAVYAGDRPRGDPLFRFEYVHDQGRDLPASHLHIHAHRDQFTRVMTLAGVAGAQRRMTKPGAELEAARLAQLHFPLGGHRFRPCLEDVLQMIAVEFGFAPGPSWEKTLAKNREIWRRKQTGAAVRDCPSEAVRVLTELGFSVTPPSVNTAEDRLDRLTAF